MRSPVSLLNAIQIDKGKNSRHRNFTYSILFSKIYNESLLQSMNAMVNATYLSPQTHNSSELWLELTIKKKELPEVSALFYISSLNRYVQI